MSVINPRIRHTGGDPHAAGAPHPERFVALHRHVLPRISEQPPEVAIDYT